MKISPAKTILLPVMAAALHLLVFAPTVMNGQSASISVATSSVPRWEPQEFAFTPAAEVENPFQVQFTAEVSGPNSTKLLLPGYYDGNGTWKVRVSPSAEGEWSLITHSSLPALEARRARFVCVPNPSPTAHGGVRVDPQNPFHFVHEDGARYFPVGYECNWLWALDAKDPGLPTINRFLDKLSAAGFNYVLLNAYAHDTSWRNGTTAADDYGPPPLYAWEGTNEKPDHSRLNLAYWQHFDRVIAALNKRGMVAHLYIKVFNKKVNWPAKGSADEDLYFRWLIARYAAYPNVHWDLAKESNGEKDLDYKLSRIRFIHDHDAYHRPITTHTDLPTYDSGAYNDILDYRSDQVHSNWHASLLAHRQQRTWPVINTEFSYEHGPLGPEDRTYGKVGHSPEEVCRRAWEICLAGGYVCHYYTYTAWDIIRPDDNPPGYAYFRILREFFETTKYWLMNPADDLVSAGFCLARPGAEYVVLQKKAAPFSLKLEGLKTAATAEWFNPHTGQRISAGKLENGVKTLTPPANWGSTPVVLHVGAARAGEAARGPDTHPRIVGLSHVAVKATDYEKSVAFYRDFLGFAEQGRLFYPNNGLRELVYLKVNDTQTIEVFDAANVTQVAGQLYQVALHVEDAEAVRAQFARRGSRVPPVVGRGQMKNANFTTRDPEGTIVEVVQYLPEGRMVLDRGKLLPASRISDHLVCAGIPAVKLPETIRFYGDVLGLTVGAPNEPRGSELAWRRLQIPGSADYVELTFDAPAAKPYFGFIVRDVDKAKEKLEQSAYRSAYGRPLAPRRGKDGRRVLDVFDPDGMRIELIEGISANANEMPAGSPDAGLSRRD